MRLIVWCMIHTRKMKTRASVVAFAGCLNSFSHTCWDCRQQWCSYRSEWVRSKLASGPGDIKVREEPALRVSQSHQSLCYLCHDSLMAYVLKLKSIIYLRYPVSPWSWNSFSVSCWQREFGRLLCPGRIIPCVLSLEDVFPWVSKQPFR